MLDSYPWPGNVRELENAIKSAMVLAAGVVLPEHLPAEICDYASSNVTASATCEQDSEKGRLRLDIDVGFDATEIDLKALGAQAADQAERSLLQILVKRNGISGAQMARMLGVDPKTLRTKLRRYGLETGRAADG